MTFRGAGSALPYADETERAVGVDARVSDATTTRGPEHTILSAFAVAAGTVAEAEAIGHEVFRAALLEAGAPADDAAWPILVGAKAIDEATGRPVQPAASVTVVLSPTIRIIVTWDDLQVLQRRLDQIQETVGLRDYLWEPLGDERVVVFARLQEVALLRALDDWLVDLAADEGMPRGLAALHQALRVRSA